MKKYMVYLVFALLVAALAFFGTRSLAQEQKYTHEAYFEHFEGTQTCLKCHEKEADSFFHSQHYQWKGDAPKIVNSNNRKLGKMNTFNDFCTSPRGNWMGFVKNSRGDVISKGCSACHAGKGLFPSDTVSKPQLENIDCLM